MTLSTTKNTGDEVSAVEWNEAATACNKVTDQTLVEADISDFGNYVSNVRTETAGEALVAGNLCFVFSCLS